MRRNGRGSLLVLAASMLVACVQHGPDLDERAADWAEVVCARWTECGCPVEDCEAAQREAFIERWGDQGERLPVDRCFDQRLEAIRELPCDHVEQRPFDWELAACPLAPTFRGLNEPCEPAVERETFAGACQEGLVCDVASRRCLSPAPPPAERQPCMRSGREGDDWLCAQGLVCDDAGVCVEPVGELPERTLPPPLVCDGLLAF